MMKKNEEITLLDVWRKATRCRSSFGTEEEWFQTNRSNNHMVLAVSLVSLLSIGLTQCTGRCSTSLR